MAQQPNAQFTEIDVSTWKRREYFYYFTKLNPTAYSVTVTMDVTKFYSYTKEQHFKFFPSFLFLVTKLISAHPEFTVARVEDKLVNYDVVHPSYSLFHEDDQSISMMWTEYAATFTAFYQNYLQDTATYKDKHGAMVKEIPTPPNAYMIGMIPWLDFTNYTPIPLNDLTTFFPIIQGGKMTEKEGKRVLPVSFTIHHAVADGYHVSRFFAELQKAFDDVEKWLV
ncbi:MAG: CatA-like O-acetyltransferase [Enterococcus sp.]